MAINHLEKTIKFRKLKRITLDIDQTGKAIYGYQEGANKGYSAKDKTQNYFKP